MSRGEAPFRNELLKVGRELQQPDQVEAPANIAPLDVGTGDVMPASGNPLLAQVEAELLKSYTALRVAVEPAAFVFVSSGRFSSPIRPSTVESLWSSPSMRSS